MISNYLKSKT